MVEPEVLAKHFLNFPSRIQTALPLHTTPLSLSTTCHNDKVGLLCLLLIRPPVFSSSIMYQGCYYCLTVSLPLVGEVELVCFDIIYNPISHHNWKWWIKPNLSKWNEADPPCRSPSGFKINTSFLMSKVFRFRLTLSSFFQQVPVLHLEREMSRWSWSEMVSILVLKLWLFISMNNVSDTKQTNCSQKIPKVWKLFNDDQDWLGWVCYAFIIFISKQTKPSHLSQWQGKTDVLEIPCQLKI